MVEITEAADPQPPVDKNLEPKAADPQPPVDKNLEPKAHPQPPVNIDADGLVRSSRDLPPAHYTFQIKNFSVLFETEVKKCESGQFEVGRYHWKLVLQTNGKKDTNSHISLYLVIENSNALSLGWEAYVNFRFFVFDQIRNNYLCIQDADGRVRRFHNLKTEWGFAKLLSHDTLNDPSKGYIVDDSCIIGAEVFVIKSIHKGVCLSMIKEPQINYFTWKIDRFDTLKENKYYCSNAFLVEGRKWKLMLYYPRRSAIADKFLSLFLKPDDSEIVTSNLKLYAKFKLRIRDQVTSNHCEKICEHWHSNTLGYGPLTFLSLGDLNNASNGYLVNNTLVVECKIDVISVVKNFSSWR